MCTVSRKSPATLMQKYNHSSAFFFLSLCDSIDLVVMCVASWTNLNILKIGVARNHFG